MRHTLLLADDSVTIQRVIELTFADEDVQVVAVSDGDQAIAAIDRTPPDIVLADVGMPGRTGYEVARHVKETPRLAHIPVVLLTGAFEPIDQAKADAAGCDGVLAKPFEPQLVIGRVKELLARRTPGAGADIHPTAPAQSPTAPAREPGLAKVSVSAPSDDYFDRLDQAFANLAASGAAPHPQPGVRSSIEEAIDWLGAKPAATAAPAAADRWESRAQAGPTDLPLSHSAPQADLSRTSAPVSSVASRPPAADAIASHPEPKPAEHAVPTAVTFPPLSEAFAALLAAEQGAPPPAAVPAWPAPAPAEAPRDLVEQVTRRVLQELSDRIVRETVAEIVAGTAERLIREEIERIRSSIK